MGKKELKNSFTHDKRKPYIVDLILITVYLIAAIWLLNSVITTPEKKVIEIYGHEELVERGSSEDTQGIRVWVVNKFGKEGLILLLTSCLMIIIYSGIESIFEYRRFLRKTKLFKQGLVQDMYDTERITVIQFIKNIFKKKTNCNHSEKSIQKEQEKNK